ncbi:MAG TPA: type I polyketide synthase, partial [Chloroflexota bacterium]|nr:type I polyketide synthase [Chloroflexota bacterium]
MTGTPLHPLHPSASVPEPIAIVGMACRFPGAPAVDAYWELLAGGVDAISEVPPERWSLDAFYDSDPGAPGKVITRWGGFLSQPLDAFDARFFGMSPREAARLDPQQRLLLEVTWEALEGAGLVPERLAGSPAAVFVGCFALESNILQLAPTSRDLLDAHSATGSVMTMVANRLSHLLDLRGPSVAVDTACSSSLVAVHLACQSLWSGESSLALAGGVNVMLRPEFTIAESKGGFLSPDGRCKAFDARANGYVRGEGAGIVVLKRLSDALRDGDPVRALIRGTAVNQDGHTNGITVPRAEAQEAVLREAYRRAGVSPSDVRYVEAHGTGTAVGDPTELKALGTVLGPGRPEGERCIVGSVKTNIGHLEAAAGVAGLIKTTLCLERGAIPPNLHFQDPNPNIPFDDLRLRVPTALEPFPGIDSQAGAPVLAGVNSFGFGGTNAHVVLQAPPAPAAPVERGAEGERPHLLTLSARSPEALRAAAGALREHLTTSPPNAPEWGPGGLRAQRGGPPRIKSSSLSKRARNNEPAPLRDISYTAALKRTHHDHRLALVAHSPEELAAHLSAFEAGETRPGLTVGHAPRGERPRLAFVCSGMGPQWWAMGRQLLEQEPVFRAAVERCDAALRPLAGWSLLERMTAPEAESLMEETDTAQPANFALQVALADLWRSWGVVPDAIVGHSAGEVASVYLSGALSWEDAIRVIYHRSRIQQQTTGQGKLAAVGLSLEEAQRALEGFQDRVSVAAINSPSAVTLVGEAEALEAVVAPLQARGVFVRFLRVKVPYHSHYMDPLRTELEQSLEGIIPRAASLPLYSTVTGALVDGRDLDAAYWWRNVREPVYFAAAAGAMIEDGYTTFLELSPHPVLSASIGECLALKDRPGLAVPSLRRQEEERALMLGALGALYGAGYTPRWEDIFGEGGQLVPLPTYPWQRERHWAETAEAQQDRLGQGTHPLLGRPVAGAHPAWQQDLSRRRLPYLEDHR